MNRHQDIIGQWPSLKDFAVDIGVTPNNANTMRSTDRIPYRYFWQAEQGAKRRKIKGVTVAVLQEIADQKLQSAEQKEGAQ